MGYLSKGYYTICLSPVFSFVFSVILSMILNPPPRMGPDSELMNIIHNVLTMGVQVCGISLCVLGWREHETIESFVKSKTKDYVSIYIPFTAALSILPIVWGSLTIYSEYFTLTHQNPIWLYLTTADYFFHITTILIGATGLVSGLIFLVKLYVWKSPKIKNHEKLSESL